MKKTALVLAGVLVAASANALAEQRCDQGAQETTPSKRFKNNGDGTITDTQTKLIWRSCVVGMSWNGQSCEGTSETYNYSMANVTIDELNKARDSGRGDWRLPTQAELSGLVEQRCYRPAINLDVFSFSPESGFWTGTEDANDSRAWMVHFLHGQAYVANKNQNWRLRPVAGK